MVPTIQRPRDHGRRRLDELVRSAFIRQRQLWQAKCLGSSEPYVPSTRWDGGMHRGKRYTSTWSKFVDRCLQERLNPIAVLLAYFDQCDSRNDVIPMPSELLSASLTKSMKLRQAEYNASILTREASAKQRLAVYLHSTVFELGLSRNDALRYALFDVQETWSPLLRYVIAIMEGLDDVAARFKNCALTQYLTNPPAYNLVFKGNIPGEFADVATELTIQ